MNTHQLCQSVCVCPDKNFCTGMGLHRPTGTGSAPLATFAAPRVSKCGRQQSQEEAGLCKHTSHTAEVGRDLWTSFVQARPPRTRCPRSCPESCSVSPRMESLQILWATRSSALQCSEKPFCVLLGAHSLLSCHSKEPGSVFFRASLQLLAHNRMESFRLKKPSKTIESKLCLIPALGSPGLNTILQTCLGAQSRAPKNSQGDSTTSRVTGIWFCEYIFPKSGDCLLLALLL